MGCCSTTTNDIDKVEYVESSKESICSDSEAENSLENLYKSGELLTTKSYNNNFRLRSTSFFYSYQINRGELTLVTSDSTQLSLASKKANFKKIETSFKDDYSGFGYYETCQ